jgi:hypothetical protein
VFEKSMGRLKIIKFKGSSFYNPYLSYLQELSW